MAVAVRGIAAPATDAVAAAPPLEVLAIVTTELVRGLDAVAVSQPPLSHQLSPTPPAGLDVSGLGPGAWLHGSAPVTKNEAHAFAISADRSACVFDSDFDRKLEVSERRGPPTLRGGIHWFAVEGLARQTIDGKAHEQVIPMAVGVAATGDASWSRLDGFRRGTLKLGGKSVALAVIDRTFRGWYSHRGLDELLVDVDGDGALDPTEDSHERYRLGQPFPVGDVDCVVTEVAPLGTSLTIARSPKPARRHAPLGVGRVAPDFTATTLDGKPFRLADAKGRWVYLDFWATWCAPCRQELPHLADLRRARPDLVLVGLSGDQDRATLERFVATQALDWPQVFDEGGSIAGVYRVRTLPRSYLIAPDGTIAAKDLRGPLALRAVADRMGPATK